MKGGSESSAVEDEQNQPRIPPIRTKLQETVEKVEEDGISALPDCLLLEILSRLPSTEDAIRTGALSKRWKDLWIWVPILLFTHSAILRDERRVNPKSRSDFVSFVDKTLIQCRHLKLKKFEVQTRFGSPNSDIQFESQFNSWVRYAVSCKVVELNLKFWYEEKPEFHIDQILFINSYLTDLRLEGCILNPTGAISWKNLRSLYLSCVKTEEYLIENILSGSPVLETLVLERCYGYSRIDITSKSVKKLVFTAYYDPDQGPYISDDIIEINAPNILSLTIDGSLLLWKLLLVNVSSLVEAHLHFLKFEYGGAMLEEAQEEMLKGFILNLRHVKDLKIGFLCSKALSRLEAKGFVSPSNIKFT